MTNLTTKIVLEELTHHRRELCKDSDFWLSIDKRYHGFTLGYEIYVRQDANGNEKVVAVHKTIPCGHCTLGKAGSIYSSAVFLLSYQGYEATIEADKRKDCGLCRKKKSGKLTKDIVMADIAPFEHEWGTSADWWHIVSDAYEDAPFGYDINVYSSDNGGKNVAVHPCTEMDTDTNTTLLSFTINRRPDKKDGWKSVAKMITMSTKHISIDDNDLLMQDDVPPGIPLLATYDGGWIFYRDPDFLYGDNSFGLSECGKSAISSAFIHGGADFVRLDRDGLKEKDLPVFDW